jgi:WD40 repeat protein
LLRKFNVPPDKTSQLAFSPDGTLIAASCAGNQLGLWQVATGWQVFRSEVAEIDSLAFAPDGKTLAWSGSDRGVHLWDVPSGKERRRIPVPLRLQVLALTADGLAVAGASRDGAAYRWETATGKEIHRCKIPRGEAGRILLTLAPDAGLVAVRDEESRNVLRLWDTATGRELPRIVVSCDEIQSAEFWPNSKTLALRGCDVKLHLWNIGTGNEVRQIEDDSRFLDWVNAYSPDGKWIASAGLNQVIRLWDVAAERECLRFSAHAGTIVGLAFSPNGKVLATACEDDGIVRLWDVSTGRLLHVLRGHEGRIHTVCFAPDGKTVLSAGRDGTIRQWSVATGQECRTLSCPDGEPDESTHSHDVSALALSADGATLASVANKTGKFPRHRDNESIVTQVWDLEKGKPLVTHRRRAVTPMGGLTAVFSPGAKTLALRDWARDTSFLLDVTTGKAHETPTRMAGLPRAFSVDGKLLATMDYGAGVGYLVHLWDVETGKERSVFQVPDYPGTVAFSPDGKQMATAVAEAIILWELATRQEYVRLLGHEADVGSLAFAPDGKTLAVGLHGGSTLIWDLLAQPGGGGESGKLLPPEDLKSLWTDLAAQDAAKAYQAMCALARTPTRALPFLKRHLSPTPDLDVKLIRGLLRDLDDPKFATRSRAARELAQVGTEAEAELQRALARKPTLEVARRVEAILAVPAAQRVPDKRRRLRAIQVLEWIGMPAARQVLQTLATGTPQAQETQEAEISLERLAKSK